MGKFLLSTLLLLTTAFASTAETKNLELTTSNFKFNGTSYSDSDYESDGIKISLHTTGSSSVFGMNKGKGSYIALTGNANNYKIVSVSIDVASSGNKGQLDVFKKNQPFTASTATTGVAAIGQAGLTSIYTISKSVNTTGGTIQIDDLAFAIVYTATSGNQFTINKITITYESGDSSKNSADVAFPQNAYTFSIGESFESPVATKATTAELVYSSDNEEVATVDASTGELTLKSEGTAVITAKAEENTEYNAGAASYTLTVTKVYKSIAEFYTVGANNKGIIGFPLTVTYVNGTSCYAIYGDEATLIYGETTYQVGDVIPAGWEGTYYLFNGLDEIKPSANMPASTETAEFITKEVTSVSKDMMNQIVILKNVTFAAATPAAPVNNNDKKSFIGTLKNGDEVTFRNNFADVPSVEAGTYDVKCAISFYVNSKDNSETLQVYPIEYTKVIPISISVPEILINGKEVADLTSTENGTVSFVVADGTEVYYKVETNTSEAMLTAEDDYTKYETPFQIQIGQSVSYYAQSISDPTLRSEIKKATATVPTSVAEIEAAGTGEVRWIDLQ